MTAVIRIAASDLCMVGRWVGRWVGWRWVVVVNQFIIQLYLQLDLAMYI